MERKTYYEKAVSLVDELNENGNGTFEVLSYNGTSTLYYVNKGRKAAVGNYLTDKELWMIVCAIGNYLRATQ